MERRQIRFAETQYFRQLWLWVVMIGATIVVAGPLLYGVYVQLVLGRPWGDRPMSDTWLVITAALTSLLMLALLALFRGTNLRTEVRDDGLYVRFFPFHLSFHRLPLGDVSKVEVVTYNPIMEYGGWGIRYMPPSGGKAYNVSGNRGVKLTYRKGNHLLIGSQHPDQLAAAIEAMREEGGGR